MFVSGDDFWDIKRQHTILGMRHIYVYNINIILYTHNYVCMYVFYIYILLYYILYIYYVAIFLKGSNLIFLVIEVARHPSNVGFTTR